MLELFQLLISGVAQGMIYALIAFGYNITFSTSRTLNFSLGNFLMLGAVVGFTIYMDKSTGNLSGQPFFFALIAVVIVGMLMGVVLYKTSIEPALKTQSQYSWILATLAFGIILKNAVERFWSTDDFKFASPISDVPIRLGGAEGIGVLPQEILIIVVSLLIVVAVELFKEKTIFGKAIQAVSEDKETASLMGINQQFVIVFSFMLSSAIACIGGILVAPITLVSASMGTVLGVKAYAVSIIGGLESGVGVLVGGLIIGLSESLTARFISTGYKDVPGFAILILIVLLKPNGLFGKRIIKKV